MGVTLPVPADWELAIDDYLTYLRANGQRPATVHLRWEQLTRIARGVDCPFGAITPDQLLAWFGRRDNWSAAYRKSHREVIRGFFGWAYRSGRLSVDLADTVKPIRLPKPVPRPMPDAQYGQALAAADDRVRLMMRLAAEVGLRRAEVAQLNTRDVLDGVDGMRLLVHGKGGKQRVVPISDDLAGQLRTHAPGYIFTSRKGGGRLTAREVGMLVSAAMPAGWSMHTLRHRFATRAYRGSRNLRAVQQLLGHGSVLTTERYTAVDDDEIRAAAACAW